MFKPNSTIYKDNHAIDETFGTTASIELVLRSKNSGDVKEPELLKFIEQIAAAAESYPDISIKSFSIVDIIKEINQVLHNGDTNYYRIPDTRDAIAQYLLLFEMGGGTELKDLIANDYATARLTLYVPNMTTEENRKLVQYLSALIAATKNTSTNPLLKDLNVEVSGVTVLWQTINNYLLQSQIQSMLLATLVVCVVMIFVSRSIILGIVLTLSNIFVVTAILGFMGLNGIALDPYLILVGAVAIGILDDDTMHFIKHFQRELALTGSAKMAVTNTLCSSGQAILYTTVVVTLSFLSYTLSELQGLVNFGLVTGLAVALGMIVEFMLTPSLLLLLYEIKPKLIDRTSSAETVVS
jgi:predicted RND superfamily exporter protein